MEVYPGSNFKIPDFSEGDVLAFQPAENQEIKPALIKYAQLKQVLDSNLGRVFIQKIVYELNRAIKLQDIEVYSNYEVFDEHGDSTHFSQDWSGEGITCEVLKLGNSDWHKGRLKLNVNVEISFVSEDEDILHKSPLDEIRRSEDIQS